MNIPPLLTPGYWFNPTPPPFMPAVEWVLLAFFSLVTLAGITAHVYAKRSGWEKLKRRALGRAGTAAITMGLTGLLLYAFYYEHVVGLSMRFFYIVWLIGAGYWAWTIYRYATVTIPEFHKKRTEREHFEKWLPKKK